jgi:hypothetical protein
MPGPEVGLGNGRQRPRAVEKIDVPVREGDVLGQIKLDAVHPGYVLGQRGHACQVRRKEHEFGLPRQIAGNHLDGQRQHHMVGKHRAHSLVRFAGMCVVHHMALVGPSHHGPGQTPGRCQRQPL